MLLRSILTGAALAALVASPASAAATIDPLNPCYVAAQETQREPIKITGHGFTPYSEVDVIIDEVHQTTAQALIDGDVEGSWPAPFVESGEREFTLRLAEKGSLTNIVSTTARVTRFSVEQVPKKAKTTQKVRFKGRGFIMKPAAPVYAHYVFGGRSLRTVKLGLPEGNCGTFNVRRKQFPFKKRPRVGTWTIQFDQLPYYDLNAPARVPMTIKVSKAIKPKRAQAR
jgi:hypothetical protein